MFCQIVEYRLRTDKTKEFTKALRTIILPVVRRQPGFVSQSYLSAEVSPEKVVEVTVWQSKEHAERFHWNQHLAVLSLIEELVKPAPRYETYQVLASSSISARTHSKKSKQNISDEATSKRASHGCTRDTDVVSGARLGQDHPTANGGYAALPLFGEAADLCLDRRSEERVPIHLPVSILSPDGGSEIRTCT